MDYEEFGTFKVNKGGTLQIDLVDVNLTEEFLTISLSIKGEDESRVAKLRLLPTSKVREMLANLDAVKL